MTRILVGFVVATSLSSTSSSVAGESLELLSDVYTVDRIYPSMKGPESIRQGLHLGAGAEPELVWITGYEAVVVADDGSQISQEFMCHNTLSLNREIHEHRQLFGGDHYVDRRLFTLSQGQVKIEFPEGFGIPVVSTEPLMLQSQVLNLNEKEGERRLRHRVRVDYVRDATLDEPMKPLMMSYAFGVALVEENGKVEPEGFVHGPGCHIGNAAGDVVHKDAAGRSYTQHWVVPPGRQETRTRVTPAMQLPFDTTAHYISVHLHPFAESIELRDVTAGRTVYKSVAKNAEGKIGLDHVDYFSSVEGLPLYKDHEYELVSVYNNTSSENQDAMALMFLYVLDKRFRDPLRTADAAGGESAGLE